MSVVELESRPKDYSEPTVSEFHRPSATGAGQEIHDLIAYLYPICRSITGNGVRETLTRLQALAPVEIFEVPTGTEVFDWTVPQEWNIRDAYVKDPAGERILEFADSNLHVVQYSEPVHKTLTLDELTDHVHTLPAHPDLIPYRTSYYERTWGFCMRHRTLKSLEEGNYEVCIDSSLEDGSLTYGEVYLPGKIEEEVLFSAHVCHPSLCNDNLSGVALAAHLARHLSEGELLYSYRFLFLPATIGSITWLALHEEQVKRVCYGLVLACLGDPGPSTYKRTRRGHATIDRAVEHVLRTGGEEYDVRDFTPYGYDERQYCSPGFDLPVGCLTRTPHGEYSEYHTSADDLDLVRPEALEDSLEKLLSVVEVLEHNRVYRNLNPRGEPQLGRRGLYDAIGGRGVDREQLTMALLWVLNLSDGSWDLLGIAERAGLPFSRIHEAAQSLRDAELVELAL